MQVVTYFPDSSVEILIVTSRLVYKQEKRQKTVKIEHSFMHGVKMLKTKVLCVFRSHLA